MVPRIEKPLARLLAIVLAPECGEIFKTIHNNKAGWIKMPEKLELLRKYSGITGITVTVY